MGILIIYIFMIIKIQPYKYKWQQFLDIISNITVIISILLA
jgi:hypothetical protein